MIIKSLKVNNYRVFCGEHKFDLNPRVKYGTSRPIILFGGLNGSGKTSILSAIRLSLYGKQSLGLGVSQKAYEEHLTNSIHRETSSHQKANNASVEIAFTYAKLGERFEYTVYRGWSQSGRNIKESIEVYENGKLMQGLSPEQCQGFLNELIPIGLSNLFFFDGEKISELAEDAKGDALGDAIKRLIGLDQFDILSNDLGIVIRNSQTAASPQKAASEIKKFEDELSSIEKKILELESNFDSTNVNWESTKKELETAENEFRAKGGAWAYSYDEENKRLNQLLGEKKVLETKIRELVASDFPIGLASEFADKVTSQLSSEKNSRTQSVVTDYLLENKESLIQVFIQQKLTKKNASKTLEALLSSISDVDKLKSNNSLHNISDASYYRIIEKMENAKVAFKSTQEALAELNKINDNIDQIGANLARAPSQESVQKEFEHLNHLKESEAKLRAKRVSLAEQLKKLMQEKLNILRQLDKLTESLFSASTQDRSIDLAGKSRSLLKEFSTKMAESKVKDLETEFVKSFERLARKDDIKLRARINPKTFAVEIIRDDNHVVDKNELSAGEKQIYAISILEALARTSGRKLPIIIDTPLGRLDSKHRNKLIQNYFPNASHQVIILSTDTEVDEAFYSDLSKHISHAYRLDYDPKSASSQANEGYFWRNKELFKAAV